MFATTHANARTHAHTHTTARAFLHVCVCGPAPQGRQSQQICPTSHETVKARATCSQPAVVHTSGHHARPSPPHLPATPFTPRPVRFFPSLHLALIPSLHLLPQFPPGSGGSVPSAINYFKVPVCVRTIVYCSVRITLLPSLTRGDNDVSQC